VHPTLQPESDSFLGVSFGNELHRKNCFRFFAYKKLNRRYLEDVETLTHSETLPSRIGISQNPPKCNPPPMLSQAATFVLNSSLMFLTDSFATTGIISNENAALVLHDVMTKLVLQILFQIFLNKEVMK